MQRGTFAVTPSGMDSPLNSSGLSSKNAKESRRLAVVLFPGEEWVLKESGIWVARSRNVDSHSVFIRLFSDLPVESVRAKIAGELKERPDTGSLICYFETTRILYKWSFSELRALIGKK